MNSMASPGGGITGTDPADARVRRLIANAMTESSEIASVVVGDASGLPIAGLVRGSIPMMTVTAIAAMSARSAEEAAAEVDLDRPSRVVVETSRGDLVMISLDGVRAYLIAIVSPRADRSGPLDVLDRLARDIAEALARM